MYQKGRVSDFQAVLKSFGNLSFVLTNNFQVRLEHNIFLESDGDHFEGLNWLISVSVP